MPRPFARLTLTLKQEQSRSRIRKFGMPLFAAIIVCAALLSTAIQSASAASAMIFFNSNMGTVAALTPDEINGVRASGFGTIVIFNLRVDASGNLLYGASASYPTACSNGSYVGDPSWPGLWAQCKAAPSSVNRIEMCIGGWGDTSFQNIKNRIAADGTGTGTVLFRNLQALHNVLGIDAIDFDDESTYDATSASQFGQMCIAAGMKVTLCPYTNPGFWQAVKSNLGPLCDQVYLQCYDGGAGNDPAVWNGYFGGLKVVPGYWDYADFSTKMQGWRNSPAYGGFFWPNSNPSASAMAQYAGWIHQALDQNISGGHRIVDIQDNKAIDNGSSTLGSGCVQWDINTVGGGTQQVWTFSQNADTSWYIVNQRSGLALEMESTSNGAQAKVWSLNGGPNQKWWVDRQSDGTFKIWNQWSGKELENASQLANGAPIIQWDWNGQVQQRWSLQ